MGVRVVRLGRAPTPHYSFHEILFVLLLSCLVLSCFAQKQSEVEALNKFKDSLELNANTLNSWDLNTSPCNENKPNWVGVLCIDGEVSGLKLENMGLKGNLIVDTLASLPWLRSLSFMNNTFEGSFPDIKKLWRLRAIFVSSNHLSGAIPDDAFVGTRFLKKVELSNNQFTSKIPSSLAELPKLMVLKIDGNKFDGKIPDFNQKNLKKINVANNELEGPIPSSLARMNPYAFAGNKKLCGEPLSPCNSPPPNMSPPSSSPKSSSGSAPIIPKTALSKKKPILNIALTTIIIVLVLVSIVVIFFIAHLKKISYLEKETDHTQKDIHKKDHNAMQPTVCVPTIPKKVEQGNKLSFVRKERERFDMHDLLRASAEVLGSGTFGSSYKAIIVTDIIVVKRYKQMNNVGREEFHEHMSRIARVTHQNLLPLVAYYYRKEEKLLITDFVDNGSLASHLHGSHNIGEPRLDWATRLRIVKGIARGLAYLYSMLPNLVVPHGHLKSSNVLLDDSFEPLLTDYALLPVINLDNFQHLMMAYRSPEYGKNGIITKKTDVWCFGILILELLTSKFPENYLPQKYNPNTNLASWVNAMIKEKRTSEVLDHEIDGARNSKGEMLNLLKIGMSCCEEDVETRLDLKEAIEQIEMLNEGEYDIPQVEFGSNGDRYAPRG